MAELVESGAASAGEIVLLFAAGTDAEWYEEELRAAGLATYRATGRGYFGQQQVVDLLSYLRLLQNRYDDEALVTRARLAVRRRLERRAAAAPAGGARADLHRARAVAAGRPRPSDDARLLRAFRQRYDRLAEAAARLSLERLCERIVADHDYDLAVLAQWDGRRRYANLRKLARLARSYEELRGPDVEGFVRFVEEQEAVGAAELEAVAEEEGADAVRLLTIHAAKGLEFKVVVVADAGRDRNAPSADEILCLSDGRFGFRVADPVDRQAARRLGYDSVKDARAAEDEAERLRLYYVAMTRAIDRLIVSGSIDSGAAGRRADADRLGARPARLRARSSRGAAEARSSSSARARACSSASTGRRRRRRAGRWRPSRRSTRAASSRSSPPATCRPLPPLAPVLAPIQALPEPPLHDVRRLSYSALALFERCSYRYYAERVAGMRPARRARHASPGRRASPRPRSATPSTACSSSSTWPRPRRPTSSRCAAWYPGRDGRGAGADRRRSSTPTAARELARRGSRRSPARGPSGRSRSSTTACSCTAASTCSTATAPRALVLDYKTNTLAEGTPEEIVEADYRLQRLVYALACFRAGRGRGRGRLPLPRAARRRRLDDVRARRRAGARGRAVGGDRAHPRRRVPADAERVRLRRLPCARRRLRRAAAPGRLACRAGARRG